MIIAKYDMTVSSPSVSLQSQVHFHNTLGCSWETSVHFSESLYVASYDFT